MPPTKRWFPVSHDINADPEVLELTDRFGLSGLKVWLEILSIADRNDGVFGTDQESIKRALSIKCNTTQRQVSGILELIESRSWITSELPARVNNYRKYHKTRETNQAPSEPSEPSEPIKNHKNDSLFPLKRQNKTAYPVDFQITEQLRTWCLTQQVSDPETYLEPFRDYHVAKGSRFLDWPAAFRTWIRNRGRFSQPQQTSRIQRVLRRGL